ncbi:MAG: hypothetical protein A2991_00505 [Candidatus Terrybacteria bacterium RIFCSPLOWO2_01_FULL_58_14]|uniref:CMP/dCMP-type deaminase domain-containing protein n=2 Tax=Candidatus Terryibacteriota TaxID=1817920 RepID=A0A1G2PWV8_9BACT|nr:MAG: hypothetical protein A2682_00515 [Candidatus Terrybacteria bacterium RIFCSPHIGHO2_01_FULL_58_15]OHA52783.1 MAG: hypothetical protein A2991_00505 [Candidatus Terrybacteria bacterium RIFCSPLOWO2_01_FULL_58_14]
MKLNHKTIRWQTGSYEELPNDLRELVDMARHMREQAYAPYSHYHVGAAVRGLSGKIYGGANVEAVIYTGTTHAEQQACNTMALDSAVPKNQRCFTALACVAKHGGIPCGFCLQFALEFCADRNSLIVGVDVDTGKVTIASVENFCPLSVFDRDSLAETSGPA